MGNAAVVETTFQTHRQSSVGEILCVLDPQMQCIKAVGGIAAAKLDQVFLLHVVICIDSHFCYHPLLPVLLSGGFIVTLFRV